MKQNLFNQYAFDKYFYFYFFLIQLEETFFPLDGHSCNNTPFDLHYLFVLICESPRALMLETKRTLKKRLSDPMKEMMLL